MTTPRSVLAVGLALLVAALVANPWTLAPLSPDGSFEGTTLGLILAFDGACLAAGLGLALGREALARRLREADLLREGGPALRWALALGLLLRVVVYFLLEPRNNDPHYDFVRFIVENGRLPVANELVVGFHPPLYYLLAAPFAAVAGAKGAQLLSALFSIANLLLLSRLIAGSRLLRERASRLQALLLCCLAPQFVLFGEFVSNDALSFLLGTALFAAAAAFVDDPRPRRAALLGALAGLGLSTKGSFIASGPVLAAAVCMVGLRQRAGTRWIAGRLTALAVPALLLGCYKFVENAVHFGTPIVGNDVLEQPWVAKQQGTVVGLSSYLDVNVAKLVREPFVHDSTLHSLPLLMYGTFWSNYIDESSFDATRRRPASLVPRAIHALAVPPTLLILLGLAAATWRAREVLLPWRRPPEGHGESDGDAAFAEHVKTFVLVATLLLNAALVLRWGVKHDAWSFFQGRLLFPSFLTLALALGHGLEVLPARLRGVLHALLALFWLACLTYFAIELGEALSTLSA